MRIAVAAGLLLAVALLGCKGRDPGSDPDAPLAIEPVAPAALRRTLSTEQSIRRLTERSLAAYERAATALEATGRDCDAAASVLHRILAEDGQTIARAKALSDVPELLERARPVLEAQAERTRQLTQRFSAATSRCASNPRVARLLDYF